MCRLLARTMHKSEPQLEEATDLQVAQELKSLTFHRATLQRVEETTGDLICQAQETQAAAAEAWGTSGCIYFVPTEVYKPEI